MRVDESPVRYVENLLWGRPPMTIDEVVRMIGRCKKVQKVKERENVGEAVEDGGETLVAQVCRNEQVVTRLTGRRGRTTAAGPPHAKSRPPARERQFLGSSPLQVHSEL